MNPQLTPQTDRNRRTLLILAVVSVIIVLSMVGVAVWLKLRPQDNAAIYIPNANPSSNIGSGNSTTKTPTATAAPGTVTLQNLSQYTAQLQRQNVPSIEQALYDIVVRNHPVTQSTNTEGAPGYFGVIRDSSFTSTTTAAGYPKIDFLVDIDAVQQSYHVSIEGDNTTDYDTVYLLCPTPSELEYAAFSCKDDRSE